MKHLFKGLVYLFIGALCFAWLLIDKAQQYRAYKTSNGVLRAELRLKDSLYRVCNGERIKVNQIIKGDSLGTIIRSKSTNEIIYY